MRSALTVAFVAFAAGVAFVASCEDDDDLTPELGAPCQDSTDCSTLCLPPSETTPGGLCTRPCTSNQDCPATAVCAPAAGMQVCLFACRDDRDCDFLETTEDVTWSCRQLDNELACLGG